MDTIRTIEAESLKKDVPEFRPGDHVKVHVRVVGAPTNASVFLGSARLGDVTAPVPLPFGRDRVRLTVRAPGFAPAHVDVVPNEPRSVSVALTPAATARKARPATNKDLENPF